ncbi:MAG TPA: 2Fe-2S iron-sulfur cluster-binding protein [Blastocatellia bacterium]|nr:2Fe-2S iron-sulfur cluster-binding protein [Blastocatellia bacterium]
MSNNGEPLFEAFLNKHNGQAWGEIIDALEPYIHEVDRAATRIWFFFFPLSLARALQQAEDPEQLARKLLLNGRYLLKDQIDSSHTFLYGHRYWPEAKSAVATLAASSGAPASLDLAAQIRDVAREVATRLKVDESLLVGITAVAFMTLQQVGASAFKASTAVLKKAGAKTPQQILSERAHDDKQGLFSFLKPDKIFTVTFDEHDPEARFKLISSQHVTTAAAQDKREYHSREPRCIVGEGPIPVECRSASCGTCWVGVLGGAEKLSEVPELEGRRIKEFGYIDTEDPKPLIRLACQAQAFGAVSIVIPPWNGVFGKFFSGYRSLLEEAELSDS